ncbi:alpha-L-glutamate ligase [Egibacter rhizosphaerae]|uniref:Alpha-L-glutamate ligase n=1 Tax=Egibacter rhizosphaerae TaxID=1670831 RepID=A0A411YDL6_9ACTN|nr:alpha-L-glutamate ligase [Egibacter rhizosphaerae]QBI19301.1 alpha-L-glutamate ligase [Egibacter rhizosphaerae]
MTVYVLHENPTWFGPFAEALEAEGLAWEDWHLDGGSLNLDAPPPEGVFWSRMSASAATRGHDRAIAHTRTVLDWLEAHGRRVVNGRRALELEVSKAAQHVALRAAGIATPRSAAIAGEDPDDVARSAADVPAPLVVKPNRGGTGWGVVTFDDHESLASAAAAGELPASPDGVRLVQEYVTAPRPLITRVELVGGRLLYAVDVDTSEGFELCPADACRADGSSLFTLRHEVDPALVARYEAFAAQHAIEVVAFEYVETADGRLLTYDVNTNTNYNGDVERVAPRSGPREVARLLRTVSDVRDPVPAAQPSPH